MMPTVRRDELNSDDIVAEVGLSPRRRDHQTFGTGTAQSGCDGKRRFESFAEARSFGKNFSNLETYRCRHCRGFHNGNRRPKG